MRKYLLNIVIPLTLISVALLSGFTLAADDSSNELTREAFRREAFQGNPPESDLVYIRGELRRQVEEILQHPATFLRTRFWMQDELSVWILDEVGKDQPITVGIVVSHTQQRSRIAELEVLAYREARGWEVQHDFFTDQFRGVGRDESGAGLNTSIDGITGATLSVRALRKVAELALLLDEHVRSRDE